MTDLRSLRHVVTLSRYLSFSRAAEQLGITQPALTRSIQALERELGIRLFDRDRTGVRPTTQGQQFVERARDLLAEAETFDRYSRRLGGGEEGAVNFGMAPMPARALLADALSWRVSERPSLINQVQVRYVEGLWPLLTSGSIEFFVSAESQIPEAPPVREEVLGTFPVTYIVRAGHPLTRDNCTGEVFPLLQASPGGMPRWIPEELSTRAAGPPHTLEDFATIAQLTHRTDAIWITSAFAAGEELATGVLEALTFGNAAQKSMKMVMYSLDRRTQSPATLILKDLFRKRVRDLGRQLGKLSAHHVSG